MTGSCKRSERWSPGSGGRLIVLKLEFVFVLAFKDNSSVGLNSLGWVRCASGNVSNLKAHSGEKSLSPNYLLNFNHHCFVCIISHIHVRSVS